MSKFQEILSQAAEMTNRAKTGVSETAQDVWDMCKNNKALVGGSLTVLLALSVFVGHYLATDEKKEAAKTPTPPATTAKADPAATAKTAPAATGKQDQPAAYTPFTQKEAGAVLDNYKFGISKEDQEKYGIGKNDQKQNKPAAPAKPTTPQASTEVPPGPIKVGDLLQATYPTHLLTRSNINYDLHTDDVVKCLAIGNDGRMKIFVRVGNTDVFGTVPAEEVSRLKKISEKDYNEGLPKNGTKSQSKLDTTIFAQRDNKVAKARSAREGLAHIVATARWERSLLNRTV